eukprot:8326128-Heterocapsa_arctica.AAC.1
MKSTPTSPYSVERYAQTVTDLLRTHIIDVQHRFSRTIVASSGLMPWLVRHVEFLQNRYGIRSATGLTPSRLSTTSPTV